MSTVFIAFLITACVLLYRYLTNTYDYWKKRNVIYDKPYIFVGTAGNDIRLKEHAGLLLHKIYNNHPNEKLVGGFLARTPTLLVKDPDIIKNIFVKDFSYFVDRGITMKTDREALTKHLAFESGDIWRWLRNKLTPAFSAGKIRNMFPLVDEVSNDFQHYLSEIIGQSNICDVKELTAKFTTDIIGSCVFGIEMNSSTYDKSPFVAMGGQILDPSFYRIFRLVFSQLSPFLFNLFRMRINTVEEEKFFIDLVKTVFKAREYKLSARHDFIDQLIQLKTVGYLQGDKIKITDELLAAQAFAIFVGGYESTSVSLTMTFYELAKNQEIQTKLYEEIEKVSLKHDRKISYETLKEMTYLKLIMWEIMRLYPPAMLINRACTEPCTLRDTDIKLDKGVIINIPVYSIHHDPKYFPEPEKFLPERFSPDAETERQSFTYMPFGAGPRSCIGYIFAYVQYMMGVISVLKNYKVDVNEKTVPKITISPTAFILCPADRVYLTFTKRK